MINEKNEEVISNLESFWESIVYKIKPEISSATFNTLFSETHPVTIHKNTLLVSVPNSFAKDWIEKKYKNTISRAIEKVTGSSMNVDVIVSERERVIEQVPLLQEPPELINNNSKQEFLLNPKHTFDSFVVGSSNRFAYTAAVAVAEEPSSVFNPLYLYGGVGLGKTHLLHAIANYIFKNHKHLKVRYVTSERFTNDFITAVKEKSIVYFQKKYREGDILLIDDIQFFQGKEQTQEEFFHTFNTLYELGKQLVVSSDRPPHKLHALEDRLRSRFGMGLLTDIQPPDLETRVAIIHKKAEYLKVYIPNEVAIYISERISTNIRELEGALTRIVAFSNIEGCEITVNMVDEILREVFPEKTLRPINISEIQSVVCNYFGISKSDLIGNKRSTSVVYPRQIAMYLCRELADASLSTIGREFGGRDHTTVLHSLNKIEKLIKERRETLNQLNELTRIIKDKI